MSDAITTTKEPITGPKAAAGVMLIERYVNFPKVNFSMDKKLNFKIALKSTYFLWLIFLYKFH